LVSSVTVQVAPDEPASPELAGSVQPWNTHYPWLEEAIRQIGPGARSASNGWRVRIEEELKTTLDFKIRPDGTAAVWCGMSGYDFRHDPTPKELFEGLAEAYRRERKRIAGSNPWKMSTAAAAPTSRGWARPVLPPRVQESLTRALGALLLLRAEQVVLIFLVVAEVTLVLSTLAFVIR
jgi:hypothetical protein